jgi:hypothetical protein
MKRVVWIIAAACFACGGALAEPADEPQPHPAPHHRKSIVARVAHPAQVVEAPRQTLLDPPPGMGDSAAPAIEPRPHPAPHHRRLNEGARTPVAHPEHVVDAPRLALPDPSPELLPVPERRMPERRTGDIAEPAPHPIAHRKYAEGAKSSTAHRVHTAHIVEAPRETLLDLPPESLSPQEQAVGEIADQNGDRTFLMVDKSLGRILLFEDGKPVFMGNALTGESTADRLPPNELKEDFNKLDALQYKVTPAGRYTVTRGYDAEYGGPLLDITEIKGKDWGIAIHQVYLGIPAEHRAERLRSTRFDDKNITFGCINVTPDAIKLLLRELPKTGSTALYVLPRDATSTIAFFAQHNS